MGMTRAVLVGSALVGTVLSQAAPSAAYRATPNTRLASRAAAPLPAIEEFDPALFPAPTSITNQWTPLTPGTQLVFDGQVLENGVAVPHRVILVVTDLTKEIDGVPAVVVWDRDFTNGQLLEEELAFEAQDAAGNVWNLGEYPEEYENGEFAGAPSTWLAGQANARAGLLMRADPQVGTDSYVQGYAPDIEFFDEAEVSQVGQRTCVPASCYEGVLVIDEWSPLDAGSGHQLKHYASGVGNVLITPAGGDARETLALTQISQLSGEELALARDAAVALDRRAYEEAPDVYGDTPRVRGPGVPTAL